MSWWGDDDENCRFSRHVPFYPSPRGAPPQNIQSHTIFYLALSRQTLPKEASDILQTHPKLTFPDFYTAKMANQAAAGAEALANKDYTSAISSYTSALTQLPLSPDYHIKRSTAYQRVSPAQYDLALQDAATAVVLAHKRGKRELIAAAQMRRGIALFGLQRWADAQQCFKWVEQKNAKEPGLSMWQKKVEVELGKAGSQVQASAVTVVELPEDPASQGKEIEVEKKMPAKQKQEVTKAEGVRTPASKIRHDWYQTADTVVVTLLVKGVPKDKATIDLDEHSVGHLHISSDW